MVENFSLVLLMLLSYLYSMQRRAITLSYLKGHISLGCVMFSKQIPTPQGS